MTLSRRTFLAAASAALVVPRIALAQPGAGRVVIIGGGFGGASAARFARDHFPALDVTLIERSRTFTTCPYGNLVLAGRRTIESITFGYDRLAARGVRVLNQSVTAVDPAAKRVRLADGTEVPYDRLVMSPGIDLRWGAIEGYDEAASARMPHGWSPSLQPITLLRRQLEEMPDGGTFVMAIPDNPFRCPPGPYERISMVAEYLKRAKPRSKLIALDAKNGFSKQPLFQDAWEELYPGIVEWRGASSDGRVMRVHPATMEVETEFGEKLKGDVVNVIPPQMAARIARDAGLVNQSGWCPVKPATFESAQVDGIWVLGDATIAAPMPKSGFAASSHAKHAIACIAASLAGRAPPPATLFNTCYSHVGPDYGISIVGVYRPGPTSLVEVEGSGGISPRNATMTPERRQQHRQLEALYADGWYASITNEMFG
ncbi:NAD(P)/FAD-dependent oxidoreductase [Neoroseomonas lacus]|uniref:Cytochrome c n=1 Tax=Neoroseomonas lacus TaxID=287609 RepID=A0A917KF46_9PROT|nr:NAD(P)/FAD-dependent oxidoreductase [Neoroseomonas lacus]GGJ11001.1 cytochrome c [Neoroseomonas lacus]